TGHPRRRHMADLAGCVEPRNRVRGCHRSIGNPASLRLPRSGPGATEKRGFQMVDDVRFLVQSLVRPLAPSRVHGPARPTPDEAGQGLAEYALILALIAI